MKTTSADSHAVRWRFLEQTSGACGVVTRRMELLYLNSAARALAPPEWFGRRCWQVFPVADPSCAARCPVIQAVLGLEEISYCEETVYPSGQAPLILSVAVIPLPRTRDEEPNAVLFMRPKAQTRAGDSMRTKMIEEARTLQALCWQRIRIAQDSIRVGEFSPDGR